MYYIPFADIRVTNSNACRSLIVPRTHTLTRLVVDLIDQIKNKIIFNVFPISNDVAIRFVRMLTFNNNINVHIMQQSCSVNRSLIIVNKIALKQSDYMKL